MVATTPSRITFPKPQLQKESPEVAREAYFLQFHRCFSLLKPHLDKLGVRVTQEFDMLLKIDVDGTHESLANLDEVLRDFGLGVRSDAQHEAVWSGPIVEIR